MTPHDLSHTSHLVMDKEFREYGGLWVFCLAH